VYQAIIFDLDDTLYPEISFVESGFRAVARRAEEQWGVAADVCFAELCELFHNGVRGNTFDKWLAMSDLPADWAEQLVDVYRSHAPNIALFPGTHELLLRLHGDHKIGLISDGFLEVQKRKFNALKVKTLFASVVFSDRWGRAFWKPHTRPYRHTLQELRVAAENAVYVGDNPAKDFVSARALGMQTVQFRHARGTYRDTLPPTVDHQPHVTVSSIDELRRALCSRQ
jgi:putative hydrolase of the HAD superfamily